MQTLINNASRPLIREVVAEMKKHNFYDSAIYGVIFLAETEEALKDTLQYAKSNPKADQTDILQYVLAKNKKMV